MKRAFVALALAYVLVPRVAPPPNDDNWPQWRGPGGLGISESADYPDEWSAEKNVAWKTAIPGRGHSSPVIWGDRIFLTTSIEGEQVPGRKAPDHLGFDLKPGYLHPDSVGVDYKNALKVLAYDTKTGKQVWEQTAFDGLMYDNRHRKNTYASSTVVTDGKLVFASFEAAGLYAYDVTGKLIWKKSPADVNGSLVWDKSLGPIAKAGLGPGTSPILYEDLLILQLDQEMGANSAIIALAKKDGSEVWRAQRTTRRSWATPILVKTASRTELIASGAEMVVSYDPATGKELWRANGVQSHPIPSPVAGQGLVFLTAGSQAKRALAIKPGGNGDLTDSASIVWRYSKGTAYVPSPILFGQYLYLMTDTGLMTCLDALTGQVKYEGGRPPVPATFTASLVAYGDRLLETSEDGDTFVIKAGPVHEVLRTNPIGEPVYASVALAGGTIYIRGAQHLFAIRR
ncbi:MAG TPA: PQQ-binding-like beta-propeller repeat protein [Vicinamibacterales bacterium]|jgi:outer membrane protein assembly factor BamB|nr:PQQ-binding-like beta-propeller repeat protein [Vicinamibacterales bacterium]